MKADEYREIAEELIRQYNAGEIVYTDFAEKMQALNRQREHERLSPLHSK